MLEETMRRLREVTGDKFDTHFGEHHEVKSAEYNLKYCSGPIKELIEQYNQVVDLAQFEINEIHSMIGSQKLDLVNIEKENTRFLSQYKGRLAWDEYELQLAIERVKCQRLQDCLLQRVTLDHLVEEGL